MPKKRLTGQVVSNKMKQTIVVEVERIKEHPKYKRRYKVHKKYKAHDQNQECKIGDTVVIEECRPISKEKRWRLVEKKAGRVESSEAENSLEDQTIPEAEPFSSEEKIKIPGTEPEPEDSNKPR